MPAWATIMISIAAVITAVGVIWSKVLKPGARLIAQLEKTYPLLVKLTDVFEDGDGFTVLHEIADQFKTNSGSSLRDAIDRLTTMVTEARTAADELRLGSEVSRQLAALDRDQLRRVELLLARLTDHVTEMATGDAMAKLKVEEVAADLAKSHQQADQIDPSSYPGEAADAASRTPKNGDSNVSS